jgi:phenylpyruvate tautomerase PptA (4-oxalocrotonate tautomerase family)
MGRDMSQEEKGRVTPHLLEVYRKNKNRIWPVIKHVVTSAYFTEGK